MSNIREIVGDALNCGADIVAHQVNCCGVMGAGIAAQIRQILPPKAYREYQEDCALYGAEMLGECTMYRTKNGPIIANLFGEDVPGAKEVDTVYEALQDALYKLREYAECDFDDRITIAFPGKLGCGLAGGDWPTVKKMIYDTFEGRDLDVIICYRSKIC